MKHSTEILVELFRRGDFSEIGLFEKQTECIDYLEDDIVNEALYGGSARAGKSVLGCRWQILRRLAYPKSYGLIARSEYSKLRDTTIRSFFKEAEELGLEKDVDYKAIGVPLTIEFSNGSVIYFRELKHYPSDPEYDRLGSYDLTDAFIDEAQQVNVKATNVLKGRFSELQGYYEDTDILTANGFDWSLIPKTLYTCNPKKNWVYNGFVKPAKDGILEDRKKFVAALPSDNPHVLKSFFDNLATADEVTRQRLLFGNFEYDDDPAKLCDYDAICDIFTNDHIIGTGKDRISADLATRGRDRFVGVHWKGKLATIAIDIEKCDAKDIENELRELKTIKHVGNTNIVADSDGLGDFLGAYLKNIIEFKGGKPPLKVYGKSDPDWAKNTFGHVKDQCAFKLAELINARDIRIICSPEQEDRIKQEISTCLKQDQKSLDKKKIINKDKMKDNLGHSPDYLDALIMGMYQIIKQNTFGIVYGA